MLRKEEVEEWKSKHSTVEAWLNRLEPSTAYNYLGAAYDFFNWIQEQPGYEGLEPEELLELQEKCQGRKRFRQLAMLQTWIQQQDVRLGTKQIRYSAIRSFYEHNHVALPRDPTFRLRADKPPVESELTFEDLKKIILSLQRGISACFFDNVSGFFGLRRVRIFQHELVARS